MPRKLELHNRLIFTVDNAYRADLCDWLEGPPAASDLPTIDFSAGPPRYGSDPVEEPFLRDVRRGRMSDGSEYPLIRNTMLPHPDSDAPGEHGTKPPKVVIYDSSSKGKHPAAKQDKPTEPGLLPGGLVDKSQEEDEVLEEASGGQTTGRIPLKTGAADSNKEPLTEAEFNALLMNMWPMNVTLKNAKELRGTAAVKYGSRIPQVHGTASLFLWTQTNDFEEKGYLKPLDHHSFEKEAQRFLIVEEMKHLRHLQFRMLKEAGVAVQAAEGEPQSDVFIDPAIQWVEKKSKKRARAGDSDEEVPEGSSQGTNAKGGVKRKIAPFGAAPAGGPPEAMADPVHGVHGVQPDQRVAEMEAVVFNANLPPAGNLLADLGVPTGVGQPGIGGGDGGGVQRPGPLPSEFPPPAGNGGGGIQQLGGGRGLPPPGVPPPIGGDGGGGGQRFGDGRGFQAPGPQPPIAGAGAGGARQRPGGRFQPPIGGANNGDNRPSPDKPQRAEMHDGNSPPNPTAGDSGDHDAEGGRGRGGLGIPAAGAGGDAPLHPDLQLLRNDVPNVSQWLQNYVERLQMNTAIYMCDLARYVTLNPGTTKEDLGKVGWLRPPNAKKASRFRNVITDSKVFVVTPDTTVVHLTPDAAGL